MICKNCKHEVVVNEEEFKLPSGEIKIIKRVYHVSMQNGYKCISNNCRPNNCSCIYPELKEANKK